MRLFECAVKGALLRSDRDAVTLIGDAMEAGADFVAIPVELLGDEFFELKTRIAGEVLQKFVTYRLRVAIVGDISRHVDKSTALRDFVTESNRGNEIWFVPDMDALRVRMERDLGGAQGR